MRDCRRRLESPIQAPHGLSTARSNCPADGLAGQTSLADAAAQRECHRSLSRRRLPRADPSAAPTSRLTPLAERGNSPAETL